VVNDGIQKHSNVHIPGTRGNQLMLPGTLVHAVSANARVALLTLAT